MARKERRIVASAGAVGAFAQGLRDLRAAAGQPTYRRMALVAHYSSTVLSEAAGGAALPSLAVALAYVQACGGDTAEWEARWRQVSSDRAVDHESSTADTESPFRGLASFAVEDEPWFFGRERETAEIVSRITGEPFLAVFGASGSGKTSLLRAGVVARLRGERPTTEVLLVRPGTAPLGDALPDRASGAVGTGGAEVVVVVDQFEEVFTTLDEEERSEVIDRLLDLVDHGRAHVLLGVRADFYARCAEHPRLTDALRDHHVLLGPMTENDLRATITGPAGRVGLRVEPALLGAAITDVTGEPGALPLLSHALQETWRRRHNSTLTAAAYHEVGGVREAIARSAEEVFTHLDDDEQRRARELLLRLITPGDGAPDTRRWASLAHVLDIDHGAAASTVLDRFVDARLVTVDTTNVSVAHEALIRNWPRLQAWIADEREEMRARDRLEDAAAEWHRAGQDPALLYRGSVLAAWRERPRDGLSRGATAFLDAGEARESGEAGAARRRRRRTVTGLVMALVLVTASAVVAADQARRAGVERDVANSARLATLSAAQLAVDPEVSTLLARAALRVRPTEEAEAALREAVFESRIRGTAAGHDGHVYGVAVRPGSQEVVSAGQDGTVRVWASTAASRTISQHPGLAIKVATSPDGQWVASAGGDGVVALSSLDGTVPERSLRGHDGIVAAVAFSPDGSTLASAGVDGTVRLWSAPDGTPGAVLRGHDGRALSVDFTDDGATLLSCGGDGTVRSWPTGPPGVVGGSVVVGRHDDSCEGVDAAPDGRRAVSGGLDGTVRIWDLADPAAAPTVLRGHEGTVEAVAFSDDGSRVASGGQDATARVWDATGRDDPVVLRGHDGPVWSVIFRPGSAVLVTGSNDGTVREWDLRPTLPATTVRHEGAAWLAVALPGGVVASGGEDGIVQVLAPDGSAPLVVRAHTGSVWSLAASPDGRQLVSGGEDGRVVLIDPATGDTRVLARLPSDAWAAVFTADGRSVVTGDGSGDGSGDVLLHDLARPATPRVIGRHDDLVRSIAVAPDGSRVATGGNDSVIKVWSLDGASPPMELTGTRGLVWGLAFSPDGTQLASAGNDGVLRLWDTATGRETDRLVGHRGVVWGVAYSSDGRWLASTGNDQTLRLWSASTGRSTLTVDGPASSVEGVGFIDADELLLARGNGTVQRLTCDVCADVDTVLALAAERVSRGFTDDERATFDVP